MKKKKEVEICEEIRIERKKGKRNVGLN